jgi:hypothetical protein
VRSDASRRLDDAAALLPLTGDAAEPSLAADILALSPEGLESTRVDDIPTGSITPDVLRDLRGRLAHGQYDSPDTHRLISEAILNEFNTPAPGTE